MVGVVLEGGGGVAEVAAAVAVLFGGEAGALVVLGRAALLVRLLDLDLLLPGAVDEVVVLVFLRGAVAEHACDIWKKFGFFYDSFGCEISYFVIFRETNSITSFSILEWKMVS